MASKLRILTKEQRITAGKLINDVLYEAQIGSLTINSRLIVNEPHGYTSPVVDSHYSTDPVTVGSAQHSHYGTDPVSVGSARHSHYGTDPVTVGSGQHSNYGTDPVSVGSAQHTLWY